MRSLFIVGLTVAILGILSFFIPISHTEHHGVDAGDFHVGVNTHHSDLLPPYVGAILIAVGGGLMVAGRRSAS